MTWAQWLKGEVTAEAVEMERRGKETELRAAEEQLHAMNTGSEEVLLFGTDAEKKAFRAQRRALEERIEELRFGISRFHAREIELSKEEAIEAANKDLDEASAFREEVVACFRGEYAPAVETIKSVLLKLWLCETRIKDANAADSRAGAQTRNRKPAPLIHSEAGYTRDPVRDVVLPLADDFSRRAWPPESDGPGIEQLASGMEQLLARFPKAN
jgi:hypothetical protein